MTRPAEIPRHGDVWARGTDPGAPRFTVMTVCGRHDPPHVTGYWHVYNGLPDECQPASYPLPRFVKAFTLVSEENLDEAR